MYGIELTLTGNIVGHSVALACLIMLRGYARVVQATGISKEAAVTASST